MLYFRAIAKLAIAHPWPAVTKVLAGKGGLILN